MTDNKIDDAIDSAVREMTAVEPPSGLRGRVIARIETPRRAFSWTWLMIPVAAAAVLVLAVLFPRREVVTPPPTLPSVHTAVNHPVSPVAHRPVGSARTATRTVGHGTRRTPREDPRAAASVPAFESSVAIEPLQPMSAISVPHVGPSPLPPQEISVAPLAPIAQLRVEPLSPPDRRN